MDPRFAQLRDTLHARPGRALNLPGLVLRESAVLAPLFLRDDVPHLLFIQRPTTMRSHAGQYAFPGGRRDDADDSLLHTALRETEEELGIAPAQVDVLGMLDEMPTITDFRITPFVGVIPGDVVYRPNPVEVAQIVEVPVPHLLTEKNRRTERWEFQGELHDVFFYEYGAHIIWGATGRILKDLLDLIATLPAWQTRTQP